jgi:hypothetical protein
MATAIRECSFSEQPHIDRDSVDQNSLRGACRDLSSSSFTCRAACAEKREPNLHPGSGTLNQRSIPLPPILMWETCAFAHEGLIKGLN